MKIEPKNQHDPNIAEVTVTVGCGLGGEEGNEPSFTHVISPDGLRIVRDTEDGQVIGGIELTNTDLDHLCGLPLDTPSPRFQSVANVTVGMAVGARVYTGDPAVIEFKRCLDELVQNPDSGRLWGFYTNTFEWKELSPSAPKDRSRKEHKVISVEGCEMLTVDSTQGDESWKYVYYPQLQFGTHIQTAG